MEFFAGNAISGTGDSPKQETEAIHCSVIKMETLCQEEIREKQLLRFFTFLYVVVFFFK